MNNWLENKEKKIWLSIHPFSDFCFYTRILLLLFFLHPLPNHLFIFLMMIWLTYRWWCSETRFWAHRDLNLFLSLLQTIPNVENTLSIELELARRLLKTCRRALLKTFRRTELKTCRRTLLKARRRTLLKTCRRTLLISLQKSSFYVVLCPEFSTIHEEELVVCLYSQWNIFRKISVSFTWYEYSVMIYSDIYWVCRNWLAEMHRKLTLLFEHLKFLYM